MTTRTQQLRAAGGTGGERRGLAVGLAPALGAVAAGGAGIVVAGGVSLAPVTLVEAAARWLSAGVCAVVLLVSGLGLGLLITRTREGARRLPISVTWALGLGALLTLSHGAGVAGLLGQGAVGVAVAWMLVLPGLVAAAILAWRARAGAGPAGERWWMARGAGRWVVLLGCAGLGCVLAMSASTPGFLWASEFGGYDALSYHLQLPREWVAQGRIWPVEHNVYSALPGYLGAGFVHLSLLGSVLNGGLNGDPLAGDGRGLLAAQMFHALVACVACFACGGLAREAWARVLPAMREASDEPAHADAAGRAAFAITAWCPWVLVTGSLAYNEMAVVLFGATALRATLLHEASARTRGVLVGVLVGLACCAKPTALLLLAPACAVLLAAGVARGRGGGRAWGGGLLVPLVLAALTGAATIAPWLVRNAAATGNPVFPFAPGLFARSDGSMAHWSAEQVQRFAGAHRFDGSLSQRLMLTVLPDASDPAGVVHRGLMHPQWGLTLLLACVAGVVLLALVILRKRATGSAGSVALALAGAWWLALLAWLFTTHVQSRFLLPVLPLACAVLVVCAGLVTPAARARGALIVLTLALVVAGVWRAGGGLGLTTVGLVVSPAFRTGELEQLRAAGIDAEPQRWTPEQWINNRLTPDDRVLLVGDATPLYLRVPIVWSTTYDTSVLAEVIRAAPEDPARWAGLLRERGITHVLVNASELARLERSGFLDPTIAPGRVIPWATQHLRALRVWEESGQALFAVPAEGALAHGPFAPRPLATRAP